MQGLPAVLCAGSASLSSLLAFTLIILSCWIVKVLLPWSQDCTKGFQRKNMSKFCTQSTRYAARFCRLFPSHHSLQGDVYSMTSICRVMGNRENTLGRGFSSLQCLASAARRSASVSKQGNSAMSSVGNKNNRFANSVAFREGSFAS